MDSLLRDLKFSVRSLLKRPGLTLIAVLTLAIGIGANSAIFSMINALLLKPLPFPDPERARSRCLESGLSANAAAAQVPSLNGDSISGHKGAF